MPNSSRSVTIKDVAKAAGVSVATVSRAMNNRSNVNSEVRIHVQTVAKSMHYVPHAGATALSARRTNMVGLVLPDLHGEFFSQLMRGVDTVLRRHQMHILVASYHGTADDRDEVLRSIRSRVDGVIVLTTSVARAGDFHELTRTKKPFVVLNSSAQMPDIFNVGLDNFGGAREIVEHLLTQGCRRVAFASGIAQNSDSDERFRGYQQAMSSPKMTADVLQSLVYRGDFTLESGRQIADQILAANRTAGADAQIDGIFCANDLMAVGVLERLAECQVDVPGRIAVAGFDDIPMAAHLPVPLTTVRTDIDRVGMRAAEIVCHLIKGGDHPIPTEVLPTRLVVRASSTRRA